MNMLRTRVRIDSSMTDSQEIEDLIDPVFGFGPNRAIAKTCFNTRGSKVVDGTIVADAFEPGISGVNLLFVLPRHRNREKRFSKVPRFANQLLSRGTKHAST